MALRVDVVEACKCEGTVKPIDLVHLAKLTMGDRELELEVLKMFLAQIPSYISMIKLSKSADEIYRAAHTLKGSASSIGAFQLSELAINAEKEGAFDLAQVIEEMAKISDYVSMLSSEA